jgi:hypothetical protein
MVQESSYYDIVRRSEVKEESRKLRRLFLRYKEAEVVYSIQHKKLLELAGKAGAIYRIDGTAYSGKSERQFRNIGTAFRSKQNE